ncbi:type II toxin-antitoxin system HicA family toxin [Candidatus Micrarchaeota archaeon]|nr:type II toxin-antitoxin system HicA family toxin [Candidatus Micrarchaeota archaeon]
MPRLKLLSPQELVRILEKLGFQKTRQKGSHVRFTHPDGRKTTVPVHSVGEIGPGLLNRIIKKDLLMTREDFEKLIV